MSKNYFEILRPGINSTFQDLGRFNQHHIGIPLSGAMDKRNYLIGNKLVGNNNNISAIEFAYQGPLLKLQSTKVIAAVTGNVNFKILRANSKIEEGECYETFELNDGDQIDVISTNKSVYGYFFINGGFEIESFWKSFSINTIAQIGPNDGAKFSLNQKLFINKLAPIYDFWSKQLPSGGRIPEESKKYFSPCFLWSRLPLSMESDRLIETTLKQAFNQYLDLYLIL